MGMGLMSSSLGFSFQRLESASGAYTILKIKCDKMWDGFFALATRSGGRRCSASLTETTLSQGGKDAHRCRSLA